MLSGSLLTKLTDIRSAEVEVVVVPVVPAAVPAML